MTDEEQRAKWRTLKQQNLPFEFYEEEEKAKKEQEAIKKTEEATKFEAMLETMPYFDKPRNDNEQLLNFQYEYRHGKVEALTKLYDLSLTICKKYVNKIANRDRKVKRLCSYDREVKAQDAASYLVEQEITRDDFVITESVTAYLWLRVIHELYYHTKADTIVDFVNLDDFYKEVYKRKGDGQIDQTRFQLWEEKANK